MNILVILCSLVAYASAGNILLTGNGVPLDTPEVASARAAHFAAHAEVAARDGYAGHLGYADHGYAGHGYAGHGYAGLGYAGHGYAGHGYAHGLAYAGAPAVYAAHHSVHPEAYTYAVPPAFGLPVVDTPEVAAAKVSHSAAHVEAKARNLLGYPVAAHGYLADTPDVAAAKAAHYASHADAVVRNSLVPVDAVAHPVAAYSAGLPYAYGHGGHHLLKIH